MNANTNIQNSYGYSLIEVVTGIGIFALLSLASVNLFLNTTVGSTKDNTTRTVKQTGDYIVSQFETSIRFTNELLPNVDDPATTCDTDMASISYVKPLTDADLDLSAGPPVNEQITWSVHDGKIRLNNDYLTGEDISVVDDRMYIDCNVDPGSGLTYITLKFGLSAGDIDSDNYITQEYETSVSIRNR